jgi:hypothetical protein
VRTLVLLGLAGCQLVLPHRSDLDATVASDGPELDAPDLGGDADGTSRPLRELVASKLGVMSLPLSVPVNPPTVSGRTLVMVIAVAAVGQRIASIVDDPSNNQWLRALDGSTGDPNNPGRVEIWYAADAQPVTLITVNMASPAEERSMAINLTEWEGIDPIGTVVGFSRNEPTFSNSPRTSAMEASAPAVAIAAFAHVDLAVAEQLEPDSIFLPITPFATEVGGTAIRGVAAYANIDAITIDARWELTEADRWNAGIVALKKQQ